ncbi:unnamed protein product [Cladocopium goreaui]|uniref:Uncharacterized protein n=1 Tax=Cladocopium goreaui TaxID=2562237 RepID=A0A9P1BLY8_9DINO|nr:unnamed protein product [Cladocopium goreaui]
MAMFVFPCVSLLLSLAASYPSSMQCDFACMANYGPGASFGYMGIANVGATSGATCAIATDVPTEGFTGGSSYTITVTSTTALGQKLTCSSGDIGGSTEVNTGSKVTSQTYTWTAPSCDSSSSASFRALCGAGGSIDEMWYAEEVSLSCAATTTSTSTSSDTIPGTSTVTGTITGTSTPVTGTITGTSTVTATITVPENAAGIAVYAKGAKTLFLYSLGMAIYSWLF